MDGFEELRQEGVEVPLVEGAGSRSILDVGLCLFQSAVDGLRVVEAAGELRDFRPHEHVCPADGLAQLQPFERGASAQGHVGLSAGKDAACQVDHGAAEGQPLALMDGYGPSQADGILREGAQHFFFYFPLLFVVAVADVSPRLGPHVTFVAVVGDDVQHVVRQAEAAHHAYGSVDPAALGVVLHEDDLRPRLQFQVACRGKAALGKVALHPSGESDRVARQCLQLALVDVVYGVAPRGQGDVHVRLAVFDTGIAAGVQHAQVVVAQGSVADVVEHADEGRVALAVDLLEFDGHQVDLVEHPCRKEERGGVEAVQYLAFVGLQHRFQLVDVSHEQELFAAKGLAQVVRVDAQDAVYGVDDVGPHHGNLVDDDQLQLFQQLAVLLGVAQELVDASALQAQVGVVRQQRVEGQAEEAVQRAASGVDGGDAGRGQHDVLLPDVVADITQEGRLARAGLACQEEGLPGVLDELQRLAELAVAGVGLEFHARSKCCKALARPSLSTVSVT